MYNNVQKRTRYLITHLLTRTNEATSGVSNTRPQKEKHNLAPTHTYTQHTHDHTT